MEYHNLQENINLLESKMLSMFPNCGYSTIVTLWNDNTYRIDCRHGDEKGMIYTFVWYNNEIEYQTLKLYPPFSAYNEYGDNYYVVEHPISLFNKIWCKIAGKLRKYA